MLFALSGPGASSAEPPPRAPLDALWQEHMLTGTAASIKVDESGQRAVSIPRTPFDDQRGVVSSIESAAGTTYGIEISRLDERFLLWRNGGWVLQGGLLARVTEQSSAIELYGKAVIRRSAYVPGGPFPRDPPMTTGYEFFLLRKANAPQATIVRQWSYQPSDVVEAGRVTARLKYDTATRKAVVTIVGLKVPVEDTVEIPRLDAVDHGVSGAKERRPALDALIAAARTRKIDAVVCVKLDRLAAERPSPRHAGAGARGARRRPGRARSAASTPPRQPGDYSFTSLARPPSLSGISYVKE